MDSRVWNELGTILPSTFLNKLPKDLLFQEIVKLQNIESLKQLILSDPMYKTSKITAVNLYRSFIVFTLPHLEYLDTFEIEELEVELTKVTRLPK